MNEKSPILQYRVPPTRQTLRERFWEWAERAPAVEGVLCLIGVGFVLFLALGVFILVVGVTIERVRGM